jgi:RNA polymerase sigma-70 factor (ECF subfamily)
VHGATRALDEVDVLSGQLDTYHLFHATRAQLLRALHRDVEARAADQRALSLTTNPAERRVIERRLGLEDFSPQPSAEQLQNRR